MLPCQQCGAPSTLTSKFCSQCGWPVPAGDVQAMATQVANDVAEGQRLFGEGRVVEALAMSTTVLLTDPDNVPALALKGDCLERSGDLEGALACYEHVVTLKPDSPLDRIRVAQLRRMAAAPQTYIEVRPERRNSILAGVAAFLLMTSAGSAFYVANKKDNIVSVAPKVETPVQSVPFNSPTPVPTQNGAVKDTTGTTPGTTSAGQPNSTEAGVDPRRFSAPNPNVRSARNFALDKPDPNAGSQPWRPVDPNFKITPEADPNKTTTTSDPEPTPEKTNAEVQNPEQGGRQPIIDIHPSTGNPPVKGEGGSQPKDGNPNEATSLIRVARQYFLAGEYAKAANAYERAIKLGASTASANHRLAQCYTNLRRGPEALAAYKNALAAYQHMLSAGIGDKRLVQSYMEECRQAIKLLQ